MVSSSEKRLKKGSMPAIITALAMVVMSCCRARPRIGWM
jgi:hypothetical protein